MNDATQTVLRALESAGKRVKRSGNGHIAQCPAHEDRNASLSVSTGDDGRAILHCHAGCEPGAVVAALGMKLSDLFADKPERETPRRIVKEYNYTDEQGELLYQAVRYEPKDFRQRRPDGKGGWIWKLDDVPLVLYRLPSLLNVNPDCIIWICEGEKDCDNLANEGLIATCNPMGASSATNNKWARLSSTKPLHDRHVCIIADKDNVGREGAQIVAADLHGKAKSVRVIEVPGAACKDVSDFLSAGGTAEDLWRLWEAASEWKPADAAATSAPCSVEAPSPSRKAIVINAANILPRLTSYLWAPRIPFGKITLLAGVPGAGKTFLAAFIAATMSGDFSWPDAPTVNIDAADVLMLLAEDDPADMTVPRLIANNANLARIHFLTGIKRRNETTGEDVEGLLDLSRDIEQVREVLTGNRNIKLLIIDPINSYFPSRKDNNSDVDVREILLPLAKLAEELGVAVLIISHTNKSASTSAITRVMGSTAFVGVSRVAWLLSEDPEDHDRKLLTPIKCNISRRPTALAFRIADDMQLDWENEQINMTADEALAATGAPERKSDRAVDWLRDYLAAGPRPAKQTEADAGSAGFGEWPIKAAKKTLFVVADRLGFGSAGQWFWALPCHADASGKILPQTVKGGGH